MPDITRTASPWMAPEMPSWQATTISASFPTTAGAYQVTGVGADAFIVKLNSTGAGVVFSTYLGGSYDTRASGVALDTAGNVYTTGID